VRDLSLRGVLTVEPEFAGVDQGSLYLPCGDPTSSDGLTRQVGYRTGATQDMNISNPSRESPYACHALGLLSSGTSYSGPNVAHETAILGVFYAVC